MTTAAQAALAGLCEAISTPPGCNDLGRLARMHSWCQNLAEAARSPGDGGINESAGKIAGHLITLLERLILDEAASPDAGIALLPEAVRLIEQFCQGKSADAGPILSRIDEAIGGAAENTPPAPSSTTTAEHAPDTRTRAPANGTAPTSSPVADASAATAQRGDEPYVSEPLVLDLSEREHLDGFLEEAAEHMDAIETGLLDVEADPTDTAKINELFRPFHTIKGIAGFLNLRDINRLTHEMETILDQGRKNELKISAGMVDLIFAGVDALKCQLAAIREYMAAPTGQPCPQPDVADIIARLRRAARGEPVPTEAGDIDVLPTTDRAPIDEHEVPEIETEKSAAQPALNKPVQDQSIRVDTRKLDILVDAVGELVIAQAMVGLANAVTRDETLHRNVQQVTKIVRDVQETAMAMRMVPIGPTFQKMRRLVRDVARKAGKLVDLIITGEETELDKNVIQQISDPLVHMVRNAVDHGVESPADRRNVGKPETGVVSLNAFHQGDSIVIEIRDDGRGLNREKLIAKGIERGCISPDDQLTEQQAFALILQAGFSTAEQITDISGRGVGMDVVKRNVEQLRGKIEIHSEEGRGSVFQIRLPLTLAIIDGMLVRVGSERMIIPTILIEQSLRPERKQITTVQHRGAMLQVRGELCPLIQLGVLFGYTGPIDPCEHLAVIVQCEGHKIALVLDELIGQHQVVIKTLGERFKKVSGVSGAAILGDGRVGLILEPSGLLALHGRRGSGCFDDRSRDFKTSDAQCPVEAVPALA